MTNTIFKYKNPNPPIIEPAPDPNKPRHIKAVISEEETTAPKRFVIVQKKWKTSLHGGLLWCSRKSDSGNKNAPNTAVVHTVELPLIRADAVII